MIIQITGEGEKTTLEWHRTANAQITTDLVEAGSHYLFDLGHGDHGTLNEPITFEQLDQSQQLEILGLHIERVLFDLATTYDVTSHVEVTRTERVEIAETKYAMDDKAEGSEVVRG